MFFMGGRTATSPFPVAGIARTSLSWPSISFFKLFHCFASAALTFGESSPSFGREKWASNGSVPVHIRTCWRGDRKRKGEYHRHHHCPPGHRFPPHPTSHQRPRPQKPLAPRDPRRNPPPDQRSEPPPSARLGPSLFSYGRPFSSSGQEPWCRWVSGVVAAIRYRTVLAFGLHLRLRHLTPHRRRERHGPIPRLTAQLEPHLLNRKNPPTRDHPVEKFESLIAGLVSSRHGHHGHHGHLCRLCRLDRGMEA